MTPKISVFITSYNQKAYLVEAIESVLAQTLKPFEIIIVDDCSTDGSQEIIKNYAQTYPDIIRSFCHKHNLGIGKNKAFAQRQVCGDWLSYLDGDDRFLPQKLELEFEMLKKHPEAKIAYSNRYLIDANGQRIKLWADNFEPPSGYIFPYVFSKALPYNTVFRNELISRACLNKIGFYDENRITHEDWDFKIRLSKHFLGIYCPLPLIEYRIHDQGISRYSTAFLRLSQMQEVYYKNRILLNDLHPKERALIESKLFKVFAKRSHEVIQDAIQRKQRIRAFQYYFKFLKWLSFKMAMKNLLCLFLRMQFTKLTKLFKTK